MVLILTWEMSMDRIGTHFVTLSYLSTGTPFAYLFLTMCRWIVYSGSPVTLDELLFKPEHSLIDQSRHARRSVHRDNPDKKHPTYFMNGDGVGVGWYGAQATPGVYRGILPAWNDRNLASISAQTSSRLFLAHVRASSGSSIQQTNCHPFSHGPWLFQHNGKIDEFPRLKRAIDFDIDPSLYPMMEGATDSERMFFLALTYGLADNAPRALLRMAERIEEIGEAHAVPSPLIMTLAVSNGRQTVFVRYSSPGNPSPTLYHNRNIHAIREIGGRREQLPDDAIIVLSEPVDDVSTHWAEIPELTLLVIDDGNISRQQFQPKR